MSTIYFEDMTVGKSYEFEGPTLTEADIIEFALKYDPQPFHIDPEEAKDTFFKGLAASGWQTAGIYMKMLVDGLLNQTVSMGSPGVDQLRWVKPVRPGDTLKAQFTIIEARPSTSRPDMGIIRSESQVFNQHNEVVMTLTNSGFFGRRPAHD